MWRSARSSDGAVSLAVSAHSWGMYRVLFSNNDFIMLVGNLWLTFNNEFVLVNKICMRELKVAVKIE